MAKICIGIPAYQNVSTETLEDYMRFAYHCGRRLPEHDFILAIKSKSEQFRARNVIATSAIQAGCDYLLFLDDDHVIDWEGANGPTSRYSLVEKLVKHLEDDEKIGIVGALYYHRGAQCAPVLMKEGNDGGFYWMRDDEIKGELQEVAVQGGGCMMIRLSMLDRIKSPWFEPELDFGTDIQISKKAKAAGFKVCCDTSIQIGHVLSKREVITPQNRHRVAMENAALSIDSEEGLDKGWLLKSALNLYRMDAEEYLGMNVDQMATIAVRYNAEDIDKHKEDLCGYYGSRGKEQLARQVCFHHMPHMIQQMDIFQGMINTNAPGHGADIGCGSAPVTFELAMRGHRIDFIDVDGAGAYEFTKWRAKRRGIEARCGWKLTGNNYDYIFALDSIEHIEDWQGFLGDAVDRLKEGGALITNYWLNQDYANPEHISMDKDAVKTFLVNKGIYPISDILWVKKDLGFMDRKKEVCDGDIQKDSFDGNGQQTSDGGGSCSASM